MIPVQPVQRASWYPAVVLVPELAEGEQQGDLNGPRGQGRLVRRIDDAHRTGSGPQQNRLKDRPRLPVEVLQPTPVAGHADTVQDDREGLCGPDVGRPAVLPDEPASAERVADAPADDVFLAGLSGPAADHTRRGGPRHRGHAPKFNPAAAGISYTISGQVHRTLMCGTDSPTGNIAAARWSATSRNRHAAPQRTRAISRESVAGRSHIPGL